MIKDCSDESTIVYLIGNKKDKVFGSSSEKEKEKTEKCCTERELKEAIEKFKVNAYFELSALENDNTQETFQKFISGRMLSRNI